MILNRVYYNKISFFKKWWIKKRLGKISQEKLYTTFRLIKTNWPNDSYIYSSRVQRVPKFSGKSEFLSHWYSSNLEQAQKLECLCPTEAVKISSSHLEIDSTKCLACGLCFEFLPQELLIKGRFNFEKEDDTHHSLEKQNRVIMQ